ncbi:MAG: MATE family efflux transporter [Spirochaetales bacterium]
MDITHDSIPGLIRKIATPFALGTLFSTFFNVTDTFFAGRLSTDALAALSLSFPMYFLIFGPGIGIQSGAAALISNALGSGDEQRASRYQAQAITLGVVAAAAVGLLLQLILPWLFRLFDPSQEVLAGGLRYMRVIAAGAPALVLVPVTNAGLIARGETRVYRNMLMIIALLNVGLDPLLMFGLRIADVQIIPSLREAGTAAATVALQAGGLVYIVRRGMRDGAFTGISKRDFLPSREHMRDLLSQSAPATIDFLTITIGAFVINYFVSDFGRNAVAAYGAALRVEQIALLPLFGISTALATLVGQNNGAGRRDRVHESFRVSILISIAAAVAILTPVVLAAPFLLRLFTDVPKVVDIGRNYLYIQALTYFSYILMNLSNSVLRGIKRPFAIMWIGLYRQAAAPFVVFPLLAYSAGLGVYGIFWGLVAVNWSAAVFTYLWSRRKLAVTA